MIGKLLNRAKGREMITSYMIAFAMDGVYQFFVLFMMGPVIPHHPQYAQAPARLRYPEYGEPAEYAPELG